MTYSRCSVNDNLQMFVSPVFAVEQILSFLQQICVESPFSNRSFANLNSLLKASQNSCGQILPVPILQGRELRFRGVRRCPGVTQLVRCLKGRSMVRAGFSGKATKRPQKHPLLPQELGIGHQTRKTGAKADLSGWTSPSRVEESSP